MSSTSSLEKRRLKDRKRNFNPQWEQDFAFINYEGKPLCLICNIALTHFKSCNLKRHYETHHKMFAADYPPWSELRRNKLLALKVSRTNQHINAQPSDRETELAAEAGQVITRSLRQTDRVLSDFELCRQLIARVAVILDPNNTRLLALITRIPASDSEGGQCPVNLNQSASAHPHRVPVNGLPDEPATPPFNSKSPSVFQRLLADNLKRIENASGCFICSTCPAAPPGAVSERDVSSSDPNTFNSHLAVHHQQLSSARCVYCSSSVRRDKLIPHMVQHFLVKNSGENESVAGVFRCPVEPECQARFQTDRFPCMEAHILSHHEADVHKQPRFKCPHCPRSFISLSLWASHIQRYSRPLVHCTAPGCLVKSPSRSLLIDHVCRKHPYDTDDHISPVIIRETIEMVCGKSDLAPPSDVTTSEVHGGSTEKLQKSSSVIPVRLINSEPKFIFLLRCPYCDMNTVRWSHFLSHASICPSFSTSRLTHCSPQPNIPTVYRCRMYWCSECQAVSTEKNLLVEHVTYSHDGQATTIRETFQVNLLDSNGQPMLMDRVMNHYAPNPSTPGLVGTSTPLSSTGFYSRLPNNLIRSASPEIDEDESESPMNLAALARPSASRFAFSNRNHHLPTSPVSTVSSFSSVNVPVTASSWNVSSSAATSESTMSLLQSAAALKTLQGLTGSSSTAVANMSASEAASAVAAMAAAALTGLTGFDVNNSVASSGSHTSVPSSTLPKLSSSTKPSFSTTISTSVSAASVAPKAESANQMDPVRAGDDLVSFPFDETKFRNELSSHIRPNMLDSLVAKMHQFSSYFVRILGKENHRRIPVCPECEKVFPYGLGDFKRHLLTVHLEVPREYLKECLRFTYLPKSEEKFQEVQEQLAMRQMKPRLLEAGRRRVPLPYSIVILRRLTRHLPITTRDFLEQKMQVYSRLSVIVDTRGGFRRYRCNHCNYSSPHALADVRKHILGSHCGISTKHFRHCLQASRLDPVEFTLFSDEKLSRLAKDYMHRQHGSEAFRSAGSRSSSPDDSTSQNGFTEADSVASSGSNSVFDQRGDDSFVSHFTAVVPGSKNRVTVRIRPPVPPGGTPSGQSTLASPVNGDSDSPTTPPPHSSESTNSMDDFPSSTTVDSLDLNTLTSLPGLEGADRVIDLELPFSEFVLSVLLEAAGASKEQIEDIRSKMLTYSTYKMSRICKGDKTIAFRCPCGRLFITTRQPDSMIRAATLADSRRHVMGVHARISHEFMTICCQASRITRECDFKLFSDQMLLRLAMDRPIKLTSPVSTTVGPSITRTVSSLPPLKPLRELAPLPNSSAAKRARLDDGVDTLLDNLDNLASVDNSEVQSVCSADGFGGPNENEASSVPEDKEGVDSSPKKVTQKTVENPLSHLILAQSSASDEVERIIDLPYSTEALHDLVEGYCPSSYFPVLEEKMNVYSSLKVFITRRRGRRYFCCSGCSSASPHGMGDIRKHILGVHAKVPERYKAAAMHCSRLSREDNTLLPNHVLLHLAKMKWKGTIIKPLAEMDLSQFGTRRASAVGLVRHTGQFASQVYQPSTQHRDSEKLTALPATTGPSGCELPNSSPTISCSHFDASSNVKNVGEPGMCPTSTSDPTELSSNRPFIVRMNGDPDQITMTDGVPSVVYACSVCSYMSSYVGAIRVHIVRVHLRVPSHRCLHCVQTFDTSKEAVVHHQQTHSDKEFALGSQLIVYRQALSKLTVTDSNSLPAARVVDLRQCLQTYLEKKSQSVAADDVEDAALFEDEMDDDDDVATGGDEDQNHFDERSQAACHGSSCLSPADVVSPAALPRLSLPGSCTIDSDRILNGTHDMHSGNPVLLDGIEESSKANSLSNRVGPSGSSRRKPSKMQLVQLKPSTELLMDSSDSSDLNFVTPVNTPNPSGDTLAFVDNKVVFSVSEV